MDRRLLLTLLVGFAIGQLGWVDPIFIPLVLAGPLVTGAIAASRGITLRRISFVWVVAGLTMLVGDWVVNREDVAFHAVLTVVMALLAGGGWSLGSRLGRRRRLA